MTLVVLSLALALAAQEADPAAERDPLAPLPEGEAEAAAKAPVAEPPAMTCPTRKFEIEMVLQASDGRTRPTPIVLCANSNDPADYLKMLRSAREKVVADARFTIGSRASFMRAVDAELAMLDGAASSFAGEDEQGEEPVGR